MKKYWHVINVGIQNALVYRVNFLFRSVFTLIPLMATIFLWKAIYAGRHSQTEISGYSVSAMISYYLVVMIVDSLTAVTDDDWQIATDIKDGNINQFILKPIDYLTYRLCLFGAGRLVYSMVALLPVALFILVQHRYFFFPTDSGTWGWFLLSLLLSGLLQFFSSYLVALLAFWILDISSLIIMIFAFEFLAGGHLFPLNILPPAAANLLLMTPFPYQLFFPVSIYLEQVHGPALLRGLVIQAIWVVAAYGLARWVWRRGMRRYSAVGG